MANKTAQEMQDESGRQEQVDAVQRGTQLNNVFELGPDYTQDVFKLDTLNVQNETRNAILTVLGPNGLTEMQTEYRHRVNREASRGRVVDDNLRQEVGRELAHERLDDAVMDVRVLEAALEHEPNLRATLNQALKEDVTIPIDTDKRPDLVILLRTLVFSVDGADANAVSSNRLNLIRSVANLPNTQGIEDNRREARQLEKRKSKLTKLDSDFDTASVDSAYSSLSKAKSDVLDLYSRFPSLPKGADTDVLDSDIAGFQAEVESTLARLNQKKISSGEFTTLTAKLEKAKKELSKAQSKKDKLNILEQRPLKEQTHRELLIKFLEQIEAVNANDPALITSMGGLPFAFETVLTTARTVRHAHVRNATTTGQDDVLLDYGDEIYKWLQEAPGTGTDSRLVQIQAALSRNLQDIDDRSTELKSDLDGLKKQQGKETSYSDRDFNVNLHMLLARNNPALATLSKKDLEAAVKMNLINDVMDIKENGRVGVSFDRRKRSIRESISGLDSQRFQNLMNFAYYDNEKNRVAPLSTYNIQTTDANNLYSSIADGSLTIPNAVFLYASLKMANQGLHPNAQILRRRILDFLITKQGEEKATQNFSKYVEQAAFELRKYEQKAVRSPRLASYIENRAKKAAKAKRRREIAAGKLGFFDDLNKVAEDNGELGALDIAKTGAKHVFLRTMPSLFNGGRDVTKYTAGNVYQVGKGTLKMAGGALVTIPRLGIQAIGNTVLPNLLKPWKILGAAISTSVNGVLHPVQSLKTLTGRTDSKLFDAEYKSFESGTDVRESIGRAAESAEKREAAYKKLHQTYHYTMDHKYDWMDFKWEETMDKSNVIPLKPKEEKKAEKEEKKASGSDSSSSTDAAKAA